MSQLAKIAITIDKDLLTRLDYFVDNIHTFRNRSQAIQTAVLNVVEKLEHTRLEQECMKLDSNEEQRMADEGYNEDVNEWPEY